MRGVVLSIWLGSILITQAQAFDPLTVMSAVSAVSGAASDMQAAQDLGQELGIGGEGESQGSDPRERKIQEIMSLGRELGYTAEELSELNRDAGDEGETTARKLDRLRQVIRAGKRVGALFQSKQDRAAQATIDSAEIQKQMLAANLEQLSENQTKGLDEVAARLKNEKQTRIKIRGIAQSLKDLGAKTFGASEIFAFPKDAPHIEAAIQAGERLRPGLWAVMLAIFLSRVCLNSIGLRSASEQGDLIRDAIVFGALMAAYPDIVRATLGVAESLNQSIGKGRLSPVSLDIFSDKTKGSAEGAIGELLRAPWATIALILHTAVGALFDFVLTAIIPLLPLFILLSQLLNFPAAWGFALGALFCVGLWPLFWNLSGLLASDLLAEDGSVKTILYSAVVTVGQVLVPGLVLKLLGASGGAAAIKQSGGSALQKLSALKGDSDKRSQNSASTSANRPPPAPSPSGHGQYFSKTNDLASNPKIAVTNGFRSRA